MRKANDGMGAVASLKQKSLALLRIGDLGFESLDLPTGNQRWQCAEFGNGSLNCGAVGVLGLVDGWSLLPRIDGPRLDG